MKPAGVICAIDVNDFDQNVVDLAATFAQQFKVDLDLVYVNLFPDPVNAAWPAYVGSAATIIEAERRLQAIHTTVPGVKLHYHHLSGLPTTEILDFVKQHEPRLLVLGTHGRRGLARLLGSTASHILRRVACPVVLLRQLQNSQDSSALAQETI